jgi:hypothetical protein
VVLRLRRDRHGPGFPSSLSHPPNGESILTWTNTFIAAGVYGLAMLVVPPEVRVYIFITASVFVFVWLVVTAPKTPRDAGAR